MNKMVIKSFVRKMVWRKKKKTISQTLQSRCREAAVLESGRFTPKEIAGIIRQTEKNIKELIPSFIDRDNIGNYQNEYIGLVDLAIYRSLRQANVDDVYAVRLVADMMWQAVVNSKGLIPVIDPLRKMILRLCTRDAYKILEIRLREMMKYPYGSPGYKIDFYKDNNAFCMNTYSCPVYEFFRQFGAEEMKLFRQSWCTFDYTAAENIVEGGKYTREHTLSDGDDVCDMRWFIDAGNNK